MNTSFLTDAEFLHYQETHNFDPIVQRLCKIRYSELKEESDEISELRDEINDLQCEVEDLEGQVYDLEQENDELRQKIDVWESLEKE